MMDISLLIYELFPIGRVLIGAFYVFFAIWNLRHWQLTLLFMQNKHIPLAACVLAFGIIWQMCMGTLILIGLWVQWAALLLIPFVMISVFIFHAFWNFKGDARVLNTLLFVTHLTSSVGALCLLSAGA